MLLANEDPEVSFAEKFNDVINNSEIKIFKLFQSFY